jgi:hypothetical protein
MPMKLFVGGKRHLSQWICVTGVVMYSVKDSAKELEVEETVVAAAELAEVVAVDGGQVAVVVPLG